MASPITTFTDKVMQLASLWSRLEKGGLTLEADGQRVIDDAEMRARLIAFWKAGAPESAIAATPLVPFDEPDSHRIAREVMGVNFHGIDAAQRFYGSFTAEQLTERETIPFSEEVLRECAKDFLLLPTHPMNLPEIHRSREKLFANSAKDPWFGENLQREKWSDVRIAAPWILIRRDIVPQSFGKRAEAQQQHLKTNFTQERSVLPCEWVYAAQLHLAETGERMAKGFVVRFFVQSADGCWVVADWHDDDLLLVSGWVSLADDIIGVSSARTS